MRMMLSSYSERIPCPLHSAAGKAFRVPDAQRRASGAAVGGRLHALVSWLWLATTLTAAESVVHMDRGCPSE